MQAAPAFAQLANAAKAAVGLHGAHADQGGDAGLGDGLGVDQTKVVWLVQAIGGEDLRANHELAAELGSSTAMCKRKRFTCHALVYLKMKPCFLVSFVITRWLRGSENKNFHTNMMQP